MDATAKKLLKLLDSDDLELRVAAARVFSELGISSKPVIKALGKCLREPYEPIQLAALKGLARLGASDVAHLVIPMILKGGDVREHVMAVVAAIGPSASEPPPQAASRAMRIPRPCPDIRRRMPQR